MDKSKFDAIKTQGLGPNKDIYHKELIEKQVNVPFKAINTNLYKIFKRYISRNIEGKCCKEGYIARNMSEVVSYTAGAVNGNDVIYNIVVRVYVCYPYEDMEISCIVESITKIGMKAIISKEENPLVIFISREHNPHVDMEKYDEGGEVKVKIIGHRFEINDQYISALGELIE
jgi:DNA-directed RNA polymerase subunit E'/Rpb7